MIVFSKQSNTVEFTTTTFTMPIDTPAKACDAYRVALAELRTKLETEIAEDGVLDAKATYSINVTKGSNDNEMIRMMVQLTYEFSSAS